MISFIKGVFLRVVEYINKGISLYASKYRLLSILNISPPLAQGRLIGVIMPSIRGGALIKGLARILIKPPYNAPTAPLP